MTIAAPMSPSARAASNAGWMPVRLIEVFVRAALTYASVMACFGVTVLTARALAPSSSQLSWIGGGVVSLTILAVLWWGRRTLTAWITCACAASVRIPERSWVALCLSAGILLRLAWITAFPATPASDGATYLDLAHKLLSGEAYVANGTRAYWPPGYPFLLIPWLAVIPNDRLAISLLNLVLFLCGALGVWKLARLSIGPGYARVALLLFALWPNLIFQAGIPEKEQALVAVLPWILVLSLVRGTSPPSPSKIFLGGVLLGAAALVQPILQLFPAVLLCYWLICCPRVIVALRMILLTGVAMLIVIGPWTLRNYRVFDRFVLISTNGGFGLYGANNSAATGGYLEHWPDDLMHMPELDADREARKRASLWIISNPSRFVALAFEKNILFMGDDAVGPYQTMKRGKASSSEVAYAVVKGGSNLYWLAAWSLLLLGLLASWSGHQRIAPDLLLIPFAFLYFFLIHSIVESSGKYHVLTIGILSVLIPMVLEMFRPDRTDSGLSRSAAADHSVSAREK
jgi:Dolichyl-phosphate-mannose-protein mannosyltransferase